MSTGIPDAGQRWRCSGCGNLTRFDVTRTRRTTEFWHFDLGGEHRVEETHVREESINAVKALQAGEEPEINDTESYDNGVKVVPAFLLEPIIVTQENAAEVYAGDPTLEELTK